MSLDKIINVSRLCLHGVIVIVNTGVSFFGGGGGGGGGKHMGMRRVSIHTFRGDWGNATPEKY